CNEREARRTQLVTLDPREHHTAHALPPWSLSSSMRYHHGVLIFSQATRMKEFLNEFQQTIDGASKSLLAISPEQSSAPREAGKWSPKQIIGHLIDSASNNHQRFVRAQFTDDLVFEGYEQEGWVRVQNYQDEDWTQLVNFWKLYNQHMLHLISQVPEET